MKLSTIGEFGFIEHISKSFIQNLPSGMHGIGDDCAVIPLDKDSSLLVTTDMLVENIHFIKNKISPHDLGYKSFAVNLSDIAAMGGEPRSAFISIAIPTEVEVQWLDDFYAGLKELADSENVLLLGGDTTKSSTNLVINITILGEANSRLIKFRSTAKTGDYICVTDFLGDSGGGLKVLLENIDDVENVAFLVQRHNHPRAHLSEGKWLAAQEGVHAMMDISDGIDSDIQRIMQASSCGAIIDIEKVPISSHLRQISNRQKWCAEEIAITGGEDYCLLTTITPDRCQEIARNFQSVFHRPLYVIGTIVEKENGLQYHENDKSRNIQKHGYDHFAEEE